MSVGVHRYQTDYGKQVDQLTDNRVRLSMDNRNKTIHPIDRKTISDITATVKTGLQRFNARQNKTAKLLINN